MPRWDPRQLRCKLKSLSISSAPIREAKAIRATWQRILEAYSRTRTIIIQVTKMNYPIAPRNNWGQTVRWTATMRKRIMTRARQSTITSILSNINWRSTRRLPATTTSCNILAANQNRFSLQAELSTAATTPPANCQPGRRPRVCSGRPKRRRSSRCARRRTRTGRG